MFSSKYLGCESIESTWKSKRSTDTIGTQTVALKSNDQSTQSQDKENLETQTENQLDQPIIFAPLDEAAVAAFLRRVTPGVLKELEKIERSHAFDNFKTTYDDTEIISKIHTLYYTPFLENHLKCTGLSWNSTGTLIAAAFGHTDHEDWCDHRGGLCVWNLFNRHFKPDHPKTVFEYSCCLTCVKFHPEEPSILVGGNFLGELLLWNLNLDNDKLVTTTPTGESGHQEAVTCIEWVKDSNSKSHKSMLVSCSLDGKILVWKQQARNNSLELVNAFIVLAENLPRSLRLRNKVLTTEIGISCLSFNYEDSDIFIIGSDSGGVFQCSLSSEIPAQTSTQFKMPLKNPVTLTYESHKGQVNDTRFSPFSRNIFMSCSSDGELRLYTIHQTVKPILSLVEQELLCTARWSPVRPLLFVGITTLGQLNLYDFRINHASCVHSVKLSDSSQPAWILEMNLKDPKLLGTATTDGRIQVWSLSDQFITASPQEVDILQQMAKSNE